MGISLRHWLLPHLKTEYHSLLSILTRGREYHSDTGCCLTSGDNTTPSCLSSLRGGNITQTLPAASPQERIPLPPVYPHSGEGISLRHWLLPHLRREYDSLLSILTVVGNITQTLAAASPQERIPLPPAYPHCGKGISLRHWLLPHLRRQYHSLLSIVTRGGNITQTLAAASPQERIPLPPVHPHCVGGNITQILAAASPQETIPLPPAYPHSGWEYHSHTGCCLTSGENTTPSCLSSLRAGNITQTLAAASPQETIPLPPVYPHSGEGISLRHWLLPHLRRQYHSLLPILTRGREYHSDTGCCLNSGENTTPSCLSSLR